MRAHHGDLAAHGKTEKHRKNDTPFSSSRTLVDAGVSSVKIDTSVKVAKLKLRACMPACLGVPYAYIRV